MIATIGLVFRLMRGWGFSSRFATLLALTLAAALSQAQYLRSLTVLPSLVTGGTSATGKLTLSKKAGASGATVTLNSSSSAATVPASVTVPGGASTASFTISTSPVSSNTMTMIEGTLGSKAAKGKLEIRAPKLISLSLNPNSVAGGESSTGTVKLDGPAPSAGIKVELRCSQPLVDLQNAVTIPGGSQQAGFIVATASITKSISATVFASEGTTSIHAKLSVNPVTIRALSVSPASVTGGNLTSGTLTLSGLAPSGGLKVDLSSDQACVIVPQGVIVPAGSSVALITVSTQPVRSNTTATITAKTGKTSVTATIVVETPVLSSVGLSSTAVVGGSTSTGTVTLTGPATGSGAVVTLLSSQASVTVPFTLPLAPGSVSANFSVTTTPVASQTQAMISATVGSATVSLSLTVNPPGLIGLAVSPTSVAAGSRAIGTVTLSGAAPTGGFKIGLTSSQASAVVPASVTVAAGSTTATFTITTTSVTTITVTTITAATITVTDPFNATASTTLTINPFSSLAGSGWPKFRGNAMNTGLGFGSGADGTMIWTAQTSGQATWSSPAIGADGTVYAGSYDGKVYAVSSVGVVNWSFVTGDLIMSSPAVGGDGTIYIGSEDTYFYAINPDGTLKWKFQTGGQIQTSPTIGTDGTIYCGSYDAKLYAFNTDGTVKWTFQTEGGIFPSPALGADGTVYLGAAGMYAISSAGVQKWFFGGDGSDFQTPCVGPDGTIYVATNAGHVYAVNPDGSQKWVSSATSWAAGLVVSSPGIGPDGTIYVGAFNGNVVALNPDGSTKWSYTTGGYVQSSPAIGPDSVVYISSHDGNIYAFKPDGTVKWTAPYGGMSMSPALGQDGTVYVVAPNGAVVAIGRTSGPPRH